MSVCRAYDVLSAGSVTCLSVCLQGLQAIDPPVTRESGLFALIVVPTRELALQTYNCAVSLMKVNIER